MSRRGSSKATSQQSIHSTALCQTPPQIICKAFRACQSRGSAVLDYLGTKYLLKYSCMVVQHILRQSKALALNMVYQGEASLQDCMRSLHQPASDSKAVKACPEGARRTQNSHGLCVQCNQSSRQQQNRKCSHMVYPYSLCCCSECMPCLYAAKCA